MQQKQNFKIGVIWKISCNFAAVNTTEIKTIELLQCNRLRDYPYKDYPLFEYVNEVANHFWLPSEAFEDDFEGEGLSYVPYVFAKRYLNGDIDISRLLLYQEAVTDGKSIKQHHGLDDDIKEKELSVIEQNRIYATLRAYGLDASKFWYLCVCIKDYVIDLTINATIKNKTAREKLTELYQKIDELQPEVVAGVRIRTKGTAKLTLNVNRKNIVIEDGHTLSLLSAAIEEFLESHPEEQLLDAAPLNFKQTKDLSPIYRISLFSKYLSWFLSQRTANSDFVKSSPYAVSTDKSLLVSRMVYLLGLSDDVRYMQEFNETTGNRLNWLKNSLKGYEDVNITTYSGVYWL